MKIKMLIIGLALCLGFNNISYSQDVKIGYTNIELVLAYMPEAKQMEQTLATYQKKLGEQLQVKEQYGQNKLQEYMELKEANRLTPEEDQRRQTELQKLDQEMQKFASDSEYNLLSKREELLRPVLEKLQSTIDRAAAANGYTYILNQTTSTGVSTILYGPEEGDITEELMKELGIEIPR